ncbi:hypothetical protein GIB67_020920 [Kingdonia uniflora]|uniref:Uncharacterized protein n=1 Tax=Kingdonia uniflora TaxID=39325 RepID=A0A7J7M7H6_9MAGN|nr:hypothetical protein GIB67_020920 [Kingdonia uniflora]
MFAFLPPWELWLVGSSAGLVCFSGLTFKTLICNPLTQVWRTLPSMHFNQQRQLIMVADQIEKSLKVITTSEIFSDKTLPTEVISRDPFTSGVNDVSDGYRVPGTHSGKIPEELDHGKVIWVEISRMPLKYFRSLLRLSAERFECFGQDSLIYFTSWNHGMGLLYDVDKKVWSWIAGCALQSYNSQRTATKDVGRIAGLEVLRIINEPIVASLVIAYLDIENMIQSSPLIVE